MLLVKDWFLRWTSGFQKDNKIRAKVCAYKILPSWDFWSASKKNLKEVLKWWKLEAVKFLNLTCPALSDTPLLFWHWKLVTTPQMLKCVEPKFAFMSMFCLHILGRWEKARANFVVCKLTQPYDWFPMVHFPFKRAALIRVVLKHSDKSIEL